MSRKTLLQIAAVALWAAPVAAQFGDPFADPMSADPFSTADPFAISATSPADPFASAPADPFASAPADPFASAPADPFASAPADPFASAPAADPFGTAVAVPAPSAGPDPFGPAPGAGASFDPFGSTITLDLSSDSVNPDGIDQLWDFRYERRLTWDGREVIVRRRLSREDARDYDERRREALVQMASRGELQNYDGVSDIHSWSIWALYAEQLQMWSEYVDAVVLGGNPSSSDLYSQIKWPGTPAQPGAAPGAGGQGGGAGAQFADARPENLVAANQNRSLDNQVGDFNPFAGVGAGMAGGPGGNFRPDTIIDQIVPLFQEKRDELRTMEERQEEFMLAFEGRLLQRQTQRLAYIDWLDDRRQIVEEFVEDWNRRYSGDVTVIGGVRYELYRPGNVPRNVHKDATVIVTDHRLTPYDILNPEDGTLKAASRN
ncbi:MAG: hypothetical protein KF858_11005 [Candidatus Sumerlaeia bacterium]|nr:hypothetical protein [Candidatus Sumerlaeia bacterium]